MTKIKLTPLEIAVTIAGALLDAPRFVDIGMAAHGATVEHWAWAYVHGATTGLFGLVMAASLVMCLSALADPSVRRSRAYAALAFTTSLLVLSTVVAVAMALLRVNGPVFILASVISPILVIVNVPFAAALRHGVDLHSIIQGLKDEIERIKTETATATATVTAKHDADMAALTAEREKAVAQAANDAHERASRQFAELSAAAQRQFADLSVTTQRQIDGLRDSNAELSRMTDDLRLSGEASERRVTEAETVIFAAREHIARLEMELEVKNQLVISLKSPGDDSRNRFNSRSKDRRGPKVAAPAANRSLEAPDATVADDSSVFATRQSSLNDRVSAVVEKSPELSSKQIADILRVSPSAIRQTDAWRNLKRDSSKK